MALPLKIWFPGENETELLGIHTPDILDRIKQVNEFIAYFAARGRRFFHYKGCEKFPERVASFEMVVKKSTSRVEHRLMFIEAWQGRSIGHTWLDIPRWKNGNSFSNGGSLKNLTRSLALYIKTGVPLRNWGFTNHWGYDPEDAHDIQDKAVELGIYTLKNRYWINDELEPGMKIIEKMGLDKSRCVITSYKVKKEPMWLDEDFFRYVNS